MSAAGDASRSRGRIFIVFSAVVLFGLAALWVAQQRAIEVPDERERARAAAPSSAPGVDPELQPVAQVPLQEEPHASSGAGFNVESNAATAEHNDERRRRLAREIQNADRLPIESTLMAGKGLSLETVAALFETDLFQDALSELAAQSSSDPLASEMTGLLQEALAAQVSDAAGVRGGEVACGLRLCVGRLDADGEVDIDAVLDATVASAGLPQFVTMTRQVAQPNGAMEYRVVFSTDPTSRAIVVPAPSSPGTGG
jgi:hypothetical protein